jgi:NSS family neurotransmitter:Na+ symporter
MNGNERGSWGSNIGFLLAAIGSAVGLGNIWGFPYKMGKSGGLAFLLIYLLLAVFVGFAIMVSELALGRRAKSGPIMAYRSFTQRFAGIGWLAIIAPSLIMTFYSVLGGYCIYYIAINAKGMVGEMPDSSSFGAMITNPMVSILITVLFMVICFLINRGGISGGIEKFNKIGMPALFIMLVIIIIRSLTLPNAVEGLKFMFVPGYAVKGGFIEEAPDLLSVLATAGGQMFFSLSLAMGAMITYGSYLGKEENLPKNSVIIVIADTLIAIMAGLAVIPAAVANGINSGLSVGEIKLNGPGLLFATLQDVFHNMGTVGGIFGLIFYILVLIAAISSAISLVEVIVTTIIDKNTVKGKESNRSSLTLIVCVAITAVAALVAADGLGSNGIAPWQLFGIAEENMKTWNDCWLDFFDCWSEGIAMPIGAMLMALCIGWEKGPKSLYEEMKMGYNGNLYPFYSACIKFCVPLVMCFVSAGSIADFFGSATAGYVICAIILVAAWAYAIMSSKKES